MNVMIQVDTDGFVSVDKEKQVLVTEVIKHFTPQWQTKAQEDIAKGKNPRALAYVHSMLNKLDVQHDVLPMPVAQLSVLNVEQEPQHFTTTPYHQNHEEAYPYASEGGDGYAPDEGEHLGDEDDDGEPPEGPEDDEGYPQE